MTTPLTQRLQQGRGDGGIRLWLKSSAYTRQLLKGSADADVWDSAASYLAWFSQAQGLLRPDVAVIEVGELYDAWVARSGGLEALLGKRRNPTMALRRLLEADAPRALLAEVLDAVAAHLRGQTPMVLAMPSPRHWLRHANRLAHQPDDPPDPDTVDDASMYLADLLRSVSTKAVDGVLLEEAAGDAAFSAQGLQGYRSLVNIARHYRWALALRLPHGIPVPQGSELAGFDAVIATTTPHHVDAPVPAAMGDDASEAFARAMPAPALAAGHFHFAEIPADMRPEAVLETLRVWREAA